ncbi:hypothetical protein ACTXIV_02735 [Psychrobacter celer]|uniref:hypothetical protein n=1 Tax=Psychrobacter celer TaxID=306572 RepID=UPI003FCF1F75
MSTSNNQIIAAIHAEFAKSNEQMRSQAKECIKTMQRNLSIEEIGDHDWQVNETIKHVTGFKDVDILDEVQGNVLRRFVNDEEIEDLEVYDETCDLRSQYQSDIDDEIDAVIECLELHLTKYVVFEYFDDENSGQLIGRYETETAAKEKIEKLVSVHNDDPKNYSVLKAQLISFDFEEVDDGKDDDADPNYNAHLVVRINGEVERSEFYVQLNDGFYMPHTGCWITTSGGDGEFSNIEKVINEYVGVGDLTESYARSVIKNRFKYHDAGFNASIDYQSLCIREDTKDNLFALVVINDGFNVNDYAKQISAVHGCYDTLEEAQAFCDEYKTGGYHDFDGVAKLLKIIKSNN